MSILAGSSSSESSVILYKYAPTRYFVGPQFIRAQVTSPSGVRVSFKSDGSVEMNGYEVRVSPYVKESGTRGAIVSFTLDGIPQKVATCDKYLTSIIGRAVNTFVPDGSSSAVAEFGQYDSSSSECINNPEFASSTTSGALSKVNAINSGKFLRSSPSSTVSSSSFGLQEDATSELSYVVTSPTIENNNELRANKEAINSQFKLALETDLFIDTLINELDASGNPQYLEYSNKLKVNSSMISVHLYGDGEQLSDDTLSDDNTNRDNDNDPPSKKEKNILGLVLGLLFGIMIPLIGIIYCFRDQIRPYINQIRRRCAAQIYSE